MNIELLQKNGFEQLALKLTPDWQQLVQEENYEQLELRLKKDLSQREIIAQLIESTFTALNISGVPEIEHMIALRQGPEGEEFEGIWHDDSSRHFAISLSLSQKSQKVKGGELEIRQFNRPQSVVSIPGSRPFAQATLFLTGKYGFEHRTRRVTSGNRLVLVLWVSTSADSK